VTSTNIVTALVLTKFIEFLIQPKFVEPYCSEDARHFPKKKKQKKTNQLLLQQSPKTSNFSKPSKQKPTCPKPGTLEINNSHPDRMILPVRYQKI
jgi:hypothetical protein